MRFGFKAVSIVIVIIVGVSSLLAWTLLSPGYMSAQTSQEISNSVFQYANSVQRVNFTDAEGSYTFLFGMDYNQNASLGRPMIVDVYISLVSERPSSSFERGVSLKVNGASALVDGSQVKGAGERSTFRSSILSVFLTSIEINSTGAHSLSARLIMSTVDVNYIGYFDGSEQVVTLNGTVNVS